MGLFLLVFTTLIATALNGTKEISYDWDVRPILSDRCFHCHGPDKHDRKTELRLNQKLTRVEPAQVVHDLLV